MKKQFIIACLFLVIIQKSFSQGWVGNGGNNLNAVNSSLSSTPINVGIGTNAPTAQFHTTGTVRHENILQSDVLDRILATDVSGYLYWRDASTLGGPKNAWLVDGNSGTNPALHFLGTIDNRDLSIRTSNTLRMTVLASNGNVGIGVANPLVRLHVSNGLGAIGYPYESAVVENTGDTKFTVASSDPTGVGGSAIVLCNSNFTGGTGVYHGYEMQYATNNGRWLRFNYVQRNTGGFIIGGISNILTLSDAGRVGVNLGPAGGGQPPVLPTADFHTSGTVRLQNLPSGVGTALVIDNNGNVFRSSGFGKEAASVSTDMQNLKEEVKQLKEELIELRKIVTGSNVNEKKAIELTKPHLYQNIPNPFNQSTLIQYSIPLPVKRAAIIVTDLKGIKLEEFNLSNKETEFLTIDANRLPAGIYIYSLIVDGRLVDSKKMILTH